MAGEILRTLMAGPFWDSAVRLFAPIGLAALGTLVAARAGVLFVGVEGVMLAATFASVAAATQTGSITVGVLAGVVVGLSVALFVAWLSMDLRAGDVVAGLVVAVGALGVTSFLLRRWFSTGAYLATDRLRAPWDLDRSGGLWFLLEQQPLIYLSVALAVAIPLVLRSRFGLRLRACGESMEVAASLGISVRRMRYLATAVAGAITGLGGAALGLAVVGSFDGNPVAGRGFIALACVILGRWKAPWVTVAALFFAATEAFRFQATLEGAQTWGPMLPYFATLLALALLNRGGASGLRDIGRMLPDSQDRATTEPDRPADGDVLTVDGPEPALEKEPT